MRIMKIQNFWLKHRMVRLLLFLLLDLIWVLSLRGTDSYLGIYILCAIVGGGSAFVTIMRGRSPDKRTCAILFIASVLFAAAVILANYRIFTPMRNYAWKILICAAGGITVSFFTLNFLLMWAERNARMTGHSKTERVSIGEGADPDAGRVRTAKKSRLAFLIPFLLSSVINGLYLFLVAYPGILTVDNIGQMQQLLTNHYSNHHPFYHTLIIKVCVSAGLRLFHDINAAVAVYSCFLILFMAAVFAFMIMTMYEAGIPVVWLAVVTLITVLSPYHIAYSVTMWKDVIFGGATAAFVTALFRILSKQGKEALNYLILVVSGLGFGLWRSNGWFAFAITFLAALLILRRHNRKLLLYMAVLLAVSFILKHPVLQMLNVMQPDPVEALSIPVQQVARVITDGGELTESERTQLARVADLNAIPEEYKPYISDPVKNNIRAHGQDYLSSHKTEFLRIWFDIGLHYPQEYLKAWIDQTRGYWNSGYSYWIWASGVAKNNLGIAGKVRSGHAAALAQRYFSSYFDSPFTEPFKSIGFTVWITAAAFAAALCRRDRKILLTIPGLAIVLSLLISTPVASEFRYAYALFTSLPVVVLPVLYPHEAGRQTEK